MILFCNNEWQHILFLCILLWFLPTCVCWLEYLLKMLKILSLWYSRGVLRFLKGNEKKLYRNLKRSTLKLERNKSHLMFNETCHNNDILTKYTTKNRKKLVHSRSMLEKNFPIQQSDNTGILWWIWEKWFKKIFEKTLVFFIEKRSCLVKMWRVIGFLKKNIRNILIKCEYLNEIGFIQHYIISHEHFFKS